MKELEKYKSEIQKCSKCGLCQAVCPVYKLTGNECAVSKGKFIMLEGVLNGDLNLTETVNKYMNMCSHCGKCKDFCPSGINPVEIFSVAKYSYAMKNKSSRLKFFMHSEKIFNTLLKMFESFNKKIFKQETFFNTGTKRILYFKGCANKLNGQNNVDLISLITKIDGMNLIESDFDCCGIPFLSAGNIERYNRAKKHNLEILHNSVYDYIITDCASCQAALKDYDEKLNVINFAEFLKIYPLNFYADKPIKVTFHKPCHLKNYDDVKQLLVSIKNVEYVEMEDFDECCGFCGEFALKNPKISAKLMKTKGDNVLKTNADIVLTACPACLIGLKLGGLLVGKRLKVMNITQFLAQKNLCT